MRIITMRALAFGTTITVLALVIARAAAAQNPGAPNISGRVATAAGAPLAGVDVRVDETGAITQTDDNGAYRFARVPAGLHILRFHRIGYLPGALAVNVPSLSDSVTI